MSWKWKSKEDISQFQMKRFVTFLNPLVCLISRVWKMMVISLSICEFARMSGLEYGGRKLNFSLIQFHFLSFKSSDWYLSQKTLHLLSFKLWICKFFCDALQLRWMSYDRKTSFVYFNGYKKSHSHQHLVFLSVFKLLRPTPWRLAAHHITC